MAKGYYTGSHPIYPEPAHDERLWRYMTLPQLLAALDSRSLHFTRLDMFGDPFEGTVPKLDAEFRVEVARANNYPAGIFGTLRESLKERRSIAANCWHLSPHESEAMWRLYAEDGVAVQSTFGRLVRSFSQPGEAQEGFPISIGKITYLDFSAERMIGSPAYYDRFRAVMHKRRSFEHEKEVRAILHSHEPTDHPQEVRAADVPDEGIDIAVDLEVLIENIYISEKTPPWYRKLVATAVRNFGWSAAPKVSEQGPFG